MIIAFDGECLLCSRSAQFLAKRDKYDRLRFTRLQDPTGKAMKAAAEDDHLDSILVRSGGQVTSRSTAVMKVLSALAWHWRLLSVCGRIVPRPLRDVVYGYIAKRRYRWFGKADACGLPSEALLKRLIPSETLVADA